VLEGLASGAPAPRRLGVASHRVPVKRCRYCLGFPHPPASRVCPQSVPRASHPKVVSVWRVPRPLDASCPVRFAPPDDQTAARRRPRHTGGIRDPFCESEHTLTCPARPLPEGQGRVATSPKRPGAGARKGSSHELISHYLLGWSRHPTTRPATALHWPKPPPRLSRGCHHGPQRVRATGGPPVGFGTLRRLQKQAATYARFTSPGCAAPSGFLTLLTR
jgi:hypothetical protein